MKTFSRRIRRLCIAVLLLLGACPAFAWHKSETWADSQFQKASALQAVLDGRAVNERKARDYQRAIDAFQRVYLGAPASSKAAASMFTAANLLAEMGEQFKNKNQLHSAIDEYQLLRREYPGSKDRFQALLSIGEIYRNDLNDSLHARQSFEEFLHRYPHSPLAQQARLELKDASHEKAAPAVKQGVGSEPVVQEAKNKSESNSDSADEDTVAKPIQTTALRSKVSIPAKPLISEDQTSDADADAADSAPLASAAKPALVTAIRHWSTPEFTKVAIDLAAPVKYESQRIENPDRIFFDLAHTHLDLPLNGKSIEVRNGLVTNIRVAQYKPDAARVVLDIVDVAKYEVVLMPNPPRLVITVYPKPGERTYGPRPDVPAATSTVEADDHAKTPGAVTTSVSPDGVKRTVVEADADDSASASQERKSHNSDDGEDDPSEVADTARRLATPQKSPARAGVSAKEKDKNQSQPDAETIARLDGAQASLLTEEGSRVVDPPVSSTVGPADATGSGPATLPPALLPPTARSASHSKAKGKNSNNLDLHEAEPTADGDRSLIRALGLKIGRIVIDPGHGGYDTGTIGPNGLEEKDLVLDVSLRLGKLLQTRLGSDVVYTRSDDTFIPLETRTAIANRDQADLFISVHANSSHDPDARGVETYYLNFTSSHDALEVAARENSASEKSIHELQDLVKKIALKDKIEESHEFASDVQSSLYTGLSPKSPGLRDRGVKKAPFVVLIGANMPSILAEISFVSNPGDEKRLKSPDYRQRIAEALYRGIAKYVGGLSGVKVASKIDKDPN